MGVDNEDPRELEARHQELAGEFEKAWTERMNILLEPQGEREEELPEEQQNALTKYLSIVDKDFTEEVRGNFPEFNTLQALAMIHQSRMAGPDRDPSAKTSRLFSVHGPSFNPSFGEWRREPVVIQDIVSELRAYAVVAAQQGEEAAFLAQMEKELPDIIMREYILYGLPVPDRLKFLTDKEVRKEAERVLPSLPEATNREMRQELADQIPREAAQRVQEGIDPRLASRIAEEDFQQTSAQMLDAERHKHAANAEKMREFGERYPDPHIFLTKVFNLHDGKLPV